MARRLELSAAVRHEIRTAPATAAYLLVLVVTTWVLQTSSTRVADRLLLEQSTNLRHLARDPIRVLLGSAFWLTTPWELLGWAVLFVLVLAPVERRLGSGRTALVFATGHVGATLLTAAGLWIGLRVDLVERSIVDAKDVGPSYGFVAVAAVLSAFVDPRLRTAYLVGLGALLALLLAVDPSFTAVGHVLALIVGLACLRIAAAARKTAPSYGEPLLRLVRRTTRSAERARL